jgi:hypothetical protein
MRFPLRYSLCTWGRNARFMARGHRNGALLTSAAGPPTSP